MSQNLYLRQRWKIWRRRIAWCKRPWKQWMLSLGRWGCWLPAAIAASPGILSRIRDNLRWPVGKERVILMENHWQTLSIFLLVMLAAEYSWISLWHLPSSGRSKCREIPVAIQLLDKTCELGKSTPGRWNMLEQLLGSPQIWTFFLDIRNFGATTVGVSQNLGSPCRLWFPRSESSIFLNHTAPQKDRTGEIYQTK